MQEKSIQNVDFILKNIKSKTGARNDAEIAAFFEVKPGTISAWKVRNSINYDLLIAKCKENNYDLNEIILGETTICSDKNPEILPQTQSSDAILNVISQLNSEIIKLAEEIGSLKEQNKALRKQAGYSSNHLAAE